MIDFIEQKRPTGIFRTAVSLFYAARLLLDQRGNYQCHD